MARAESNGFADVIIGLQHGDEGKGRFVDGIACQYDWVARYNGGPNAGHTIEVGGNRLALHQVPSGVNHAKQRLFIASDCVVNLHKLLAEVEALEAVGLTVRNRLLISPLASVIQPSHVLRDAASMAAIGTTRNGIGPAYGDRANRIDGDRQLDVRLGDLTEEPERFFAAIEKNLHAEHERVGGQYADLYSGKKQIEEMRLALEHLRHCVAPSSYMLIDAVRNGARVLLEGAQSFGLDNTFGTTPNVTASRTGVAAGFLSTGIPLEYKRFAYGVAKATPSRVGSGPFPSEWGGMRSADHCRTATRVQEQQVFGARIAELLASEDPFEMGVAIRMLGGEYGATTGRPRRMGALDLPFLRHAIAPNGIDAIFLTKVDCLRDFERTRFKGIPIVHSYNDAGQRLAHVPVTDRGLSQVETEQRLYEAFSDDISAVRDASRLPPSVRHLLASLEEELGTPIARIGVGPERSQEVVVKRL